MSLFPTDPGSLVLRLGRRERILSLYLGDMMMMLLSDMHCESSSLFICVNAMFILILLIKKVPSLAPEGVISKGRRRSLRTYAYLVVFLRIILLLGVDMCNRLAPDSTSKLRPVI